MKFLTVVVLACAAVICAEEGKQTTKLNAVLSVLKCFDELSTSDDNPSPNNKSDMSEVSKDYQCFTKCVLSKSGFYVNGVIQEEAIALAFAPTIGDEQLKLTMEKCNSLKGDNECETTFKVFDCYIDTNPALYDLLFEDA